MDEDWISDTGTVDGDVYNIYTFNNDIEQAEEPEVVRATPQEPPVAFNFTPKAIQHKNIRGNSVTLNSNYTPVHKEYVKIEVKDKAVEVQKPKLVSAPPGLSRSFPKGPPPGLNPPPGLGPKSVPPGLGIEPSIVNSPFEDVLVEDVFVEDVFVEDVFVEGQVSLPTVSNPTESLDFRTSSQTNNDISSSSDTHIYEQSSHFSAIDKQISFKQLKVTQAIENENENLREELELKQATQLAYTKVPGGNGRFKNLDSDLVEFFNEMNKKTFTEQAIQYLNAFWNEIGDQAEFIFSVAHQIFREADMHRQGISLFYQYEEGCDVDYPTYLYFYEKLCKYVENNSKWREGEYQKSAVYEVKTAIEHKKDLREKVDVNFDGRISFIEYLLYQYNVYSTPTQLMERMILCGEEHPAVTSAKLALDDVNTAIRLYEEERGKLEEGIRIGGVQGLSCKHQLAMIDSSPLVEQLNAALIKAEAAVRKALKKFQGNNISIGSPVGASPQGALWWMQRDLRDKKRYGRN